MTETKRVLTVNLHRKLYSDDKIINNINYLGYDLQLSEEDIDDIVSQLPSYWNTGKDCLIKFVYYEDGTYMCQRQKEVYNYSLRETESKIYFFDAADKKEVSELVVFFAEFLGKVKIKKIENIYDKILNNINDFSFIKFNLLETRKKFLHESDYKMMPDYPLTEEEKMRWSEYRQQLRDITEQEAWKNNDFVNVILPTSPIPKDQLLELFQNLRQVAGNKIPPNILEKFNSTLSNIGVENVIKKYSEMTLKLEIINGLSRLGLPFAIYDGESVTIDKLLPIKKETLANDIKNGEIDYFSEKVITQWQQYLIDIDEKIEDINRQLNSYNMDFTIGDIIREISDYTKSKLDEIDKMEEVDKLLMDLSIENNYAEFADNLVESYEKNENSIEEE
jgi:hypothetical protein